MKAVKRINALLPGVIQRAAHRHRPLFAIQRGWRKLVGEELAAHTKPVSLRRGQLIVHVDQPGDGFALNYERPRLLKRLQTKTKGGVEDIVIRAGDAHAVSH